MIDERGIPEQAKPDFRRYREWYALHSLALWDEQSIDDVLWMTWCAAQHYCLTRP